MKARRGRGEGSVYQRSDGLWRGTASLGWDEKGRRRRKAVYAKTKAELLTKLNEITPGPEAASAYDAQRGSVKDHLERWLASKARIRPSTRRLYELVIRVHLVPAIGKLTLGALTRHGVIESLVARLKQDDVGDRTIEVCLLVLKASLRRAVRRRLLPFNPVDDVEAPRPAKRVMQTWSDAHVRAFLDDVAGDRHHALYILALTTGMRQGELLGLRRADVDLDRGFVSVAKQRTADPTKTAGSRRRINLSNIARDALRAHFVRLDEDDVDSELAFPSEAGTVINPRNLVLRSFDPAIAHANEELKKKGQTLRIPRIRFQDLRHTCATLLLERGVHPKLVAEMLGHASVKITLDTYSHVTPTMHQAAADQFDLMLSSNGVSKLGKSNKHRQKTPATR